MARDEMANVFQHIIKGNEFGRRRITTSSIKRVAALVGEDFTDEEIKEMVEEADRDSDGEVTLEDFIRIMVIYVISTFLTKSKIFFYRKHGTSNPINNTDS